MKQTNLTKPLLVALLLLCSLYANAYDFAAKNDEGVTIYYNITSSAAENPTVEVTYPNTSRPNSSNFSEYSGTSYTIPNNVSYGGVTYAVTSIGTYAFYQCRGITSLDLGNGLTTIGNYAFAGCWSLTSLDIPSSVTTIGEGAFGACEGLTEITIPDSVTSIGWEAFEYCSGLTSVTIGNGLTEIGGYVFAFCRHMKYAYISKSVTTIGKYAFGSCDDMKAVYSYNSVPPECGYQAFHGPSQDAVLYIPIGSYSAYLEADEWKDFHIIFATLDGIESVSADGATVAGYYTIDGKAVDALQRGVNILRYSDGTTKKVLVK